MSSATVHDVCCPALVLRRVNYGEADRILSLLTPGGLVGVMAKGVRKEKSKLAGGIELFCLSEVTYHQSKTSGLAILTSAKMQKFYSHILTDLARMEFASTVFKKVSRAAEQVDGPEFFELTRPILEFLNTPAPQTLIETYFWLNFAAITGEPVNFSRDTTGARLSPDQTYAWDATELAFAPHPHGIYAADDIKFLRLMLASPLALAARVIYPAEKLDNLLYIAKTLSQQ